MKFFSSSIKYFSLILLVVFIIGCGRLEIYQNLTEEEANEILVLLATNNIKAVKKKVVVQNETSYAVDVREVDLIKARSLLLDHNLPRKKELGLTGVYKEKGLIPTPDEQKARYLLAMKGEIINSLEKVPQIVDTDVVLNIPTKDEFASPEKQRQQRPTASVVIKIRPDAGGAETISETQVQQFVANSVEGLNPRDVAVIITYATNDEKVMRPSDVKTIPSQGSGQAFPGEQMGGQIAPTTHELMGLKLDEESKGRLKVYLLIFFLLLMILATSLIVTIIQASRMRRILASVQGPAGEHPAIEGQVMDESPPKLGDGE